MWAQVVLQALQAVPLIIEAIERGVSASGPAKHGAAVAELQQFEPSAAVQDESVAAARDALIKAQVAYANALAAVGGGTP